MYCAQHALAVLSARPRLVIIAGFALALALAAAAAILSARAGGNPLATWYHTGPHRALATWYHTRPASLYHG
jgi:hypothetical protein